MVLLVAGSGNGMPVPQAVSRPADQVRATEVVTAGPTPLRITGTLQTYDAEAKLVAVATAAGKLRLLVTQDSRIRQGGHVVDADQLGARLGSKVVVRYLEADRGRVVVSLTVLGHGNDGPH
jgi:hypothetical protein